MPDERKQLDINLQAELKEINNRLQTLREAVAGKAESAPVIPLLDPTVNVLNLVSAGFKRQDDLRDAENRCLEKLRYLEEKFNSELSTVHLQAQKDLAAAESKRIDALTLAESRRIDALLAAQQNAVALASEKSAAQAATLATQVATTGAATANQITTLRESLEKRLMAVEQNQYQSGGVSLQRTEGRQEKQWVVGLLIMMALGIGAMLMRVIK